MNLVRSWERLSTHRCSFAAHSPHCRWHNKPNVILWQRKTVVCRLSLPGVVCGLISAPGQVSRKEKSRGLISLRQLIAMTGAVRSMGTHALRILGRVVDLTRWSHAHGRGHRWSHRTHGVKHWRPETWQRRREEELTVWSSFIICLTEHHHQTPWEYLNIYWHI